MSRPAARAGRHQPDALGFLQGYFHRSELPLTMLLFLLPMVLAYEIGARWWLTTPTGGGHILAFSYTRQFLSLFGATGAYLPALSVVVILLAWHMARRDPWRMNLGTVGAMALESALLAIPLLAWGSVIGMYLPLWTGHDTAGHIVLAFGAGVYEELVFRLVMFTALNVLLVDLLKAPRGLALAIMLSSSAVLFAAYHHFSPQSDPLLWQDFAFRVLAGAYLGVLFLTRGFGITAGTHAAYDAYFFLLQPG